MIRSLMRQPSSQVTSAKSFAQREQHSGAATRLPSGRTVRTSHREDRETIQVTSPQGETELHIEFTENGPVLRFQSAALDLQADAVRMKCRTFELQASEQIVERSGGGVDRSAAGNVKETVGGDLVTEARIVDVRARRGDVRLRANDDVRLNGERVKLNC